MAADSANGHINRIDIRVGVAGRDSDVSGLQIGFVVKAKREIRLAKPIVKAGF